MSVVAAEADVLQLFAESELVAAIQHAVRDALEMCRLPIRCVSVACVPSREGGNVTGLLGVHGKTSGFVTVNLSERFARKAVEGLVGDRFERMSSQVVDGVGELTNIIAGGIKGRLSGSPWAFTNITVPSVILGSGYHIAYAPSLKFACVTFEHQDHEAIMLDDRLLHVSMSLLKL